jgi:peptide/nickel transport system permease protein
LRQQGVVKPTVENDDALYEVALEKPTSELADILAKHPNETADFAAVLNNFSTYHVLGTDELGRDVMMRLIFGTRVSIGFGILVAIAAAFIGLLIGCLAGYYGGWIDAILSRILDSLLSLPLIPLMIVFAAVDLTRFPFIDGLIGGENESFFKLVIVIVLFSWMTAARLVRGSILAMKEQDFILAAKTLGAKDRSIILSHIIPNVISPLLVAVTLNVGNSILSEAALSFLGLGIQPPTPSWGNMLFKAQELMFDAPFLAILPGVFILLTVISFNFIGDGLQSAVDPKSIKR